MKAPSSQHHFENSLIARQSGFIRTSFSIELSMQQKSLFCECIAKTWPKAFHGRTSIYSNIMQTILKFHRWTQNFLKYDHHESITKILSKFDSVVITIFVQELYKQPKVFNTQISMAPIRIFLRQSGENLSVNLKTSNPLYI